MDGSSTKAKSMMRYTYYLTGRVCYLEQPSIFLKYLYLCVAGTAFFCINIIGAFGYFLTAKSVTLIDAIVTISSIDGTTYALIFIPVITYFYRTELDVLLEYINSAMHCDLDFKQPYLAAQMKKEPKSFIIQRHNSVGVMKLWIVVELVVSVTFLLTPFIQTLFSSTRENPQTNLQNHVTAIPFPQRITSLSVYVLVYIVEACMFSTAICLAMNKSIFVMMAAYELNNAVYAYCNQIRCLSTELTTQFEEILRRDYIKSEQKEEDCCRLFAYFEKNLISVINQHQRFARTTRPIMSYMNYFGSVMLIAAVTMQIMAGYILLKSDLESAIKAKYLLLGLIVYISFHPFCEVGNIFNIMNEAMANEIYNMPWYHMPPKLRQVVDIFHGQARQRKEIKGFGVHTLSRSLVPSVLRLIYTYVNVLRRVS